ncbi:MAG TPA: cytochrome c oxidase subunit I [Gemmatimonadaceae bacterium]|nr:cytochrome c oxidase subunit I [Gemmatimonadaceae bacterium]
MTTLQPTTSQVAEFERTWSEPRGFIGALKTINNIPVAHRYMVTAAVFFLVGGVQALLMRIQLGTANNTFLSPDVYNQLFTMHGTTMMFLVVIPFIEALASYFLPLLLGTRDLPFPRLTALSYWTYLFGGIFLYSSFVVGAAPDGGWFSYLPLNDKEFAPGINMDFWDIGLSVAEVSAIGAAAEIIVGVLRMRAPGMTFARLPIFAWAMLIVAFMLILAFTPLVVATAMLELDRKGLTQFFDVARGGDPILWQHLFWVFGHPEVYIMFLPAVGIVSHVVQTFARRPLANYKAVVMTMVATGVVSFLLWAHHMFVAGMSPNAMRFFMIASMLIAIPAGIQVLSWIATLWGARARWTTSLHFVAGFIVLFVLGGLTGVMVASAPFDAQVHDSYFVVAHFHYVLIGGVIFPFFAGMYYWLPKITGRLLSERLGKWNFWIMFVGFNVAFFPMHIAGLLGMPRRVYTYETGLGWDVANLISTLGALTLGFGVLLFVINAARSGRRGKEAGNNPWSSDTLEWSEESPPPSAQFVSIPVVHSRHPLWNEGETTQRDVVLTAVPARWRGALCVSLRGAKPESIVHMPGPTPWPFLMSVAFVFLFAGALIDSGILAVIGAAGTSVTLVGWFWPTKSERMAVSEMATHDSHGQPPLGIAGPLANGWWGTLVLNVVLATALGTIVASYLYLAPRWTDRTPVDFTEMLLAWLAVLTALVGAVAAWWGGRDRNLNTADRRRFGLSVGFMLDAGLLVLLWWLYAYHETSSTRSIDALGSFYYLMFVFQAFITLLHFVWTGVSLVWAWRLPRDIRGLAPASNVALLSYFLVLSWVTVAITLYV